MAAFSGIKTPPHLAGFNFRYDSRRSLNLSGVDGDKTRYVYDGERRRVLKIRSDGEVRYFYDRSQHLVYERGPDGSQRNYVWLGDIPLAVIDQNAAGTVTVRHYIETDFANTPRFLRRATDNATVRCALRQRQAHRKRGL